MMEHRRDAAAVAGALARRAPALAAELLPAGRREGQNWRVGSLAGERGGSLAINLNGPYAGRWTDFATGERGDAVDLVAAVLFGGNVRDALDWARAWLGLAHGGYPPEQRRPVSTATDPVSDATERAKRAERGWLPSTAVPGTPAEAYLTRRGLRHLACCSVLRWCPNATHPAAGGWHPALVALVQSVEGAPVAIHRTYLTLAGEQARHLSRSKAALGSVSGGAVRLDPAETEMVVGEGIESSASAGVLLGLPAWAALSTAGLRTLLLPPLVRRVTIAADHDVNGAGQAAAGNAAQRWTREGRTVRIALPDSPGQDFNDVLQARAQRAAEAAHG